jgi:myo-inositol-1(or 4)-monophosphatase
MCCDETVSATDDPDREPAALRTIAEGLAAEAAAFVRRRRAEVFGVDAPREGDTSAVHSKSTPTDPVTVVDTETERLLRERLAELRPGDPVVGEEEGGSPDARPGRPTWVLDPIDGTVNFVYGIEAYAVSVGVQVDGASVAGAVANVPTGEVFSAAVGHGAVVRRGDTSIRLRCNDVTDLSMALVGTGFAYAPERRRMQAEVLTRLLPEVRDVRRMGSCALDLCMVAAGRLDAYYEDGVHVWDWAAGALVAAEAGAWLRLPPGDGNSEFIAAAAPGIAEEFDAALRRVGAGCGVGGA